VEWQVTTRTARRLLFRTPLWNGNRERWRNLHHASHPIRWAWRKHGVYRQRYGARFASASASDHGQILVRLTSRRAVRNWLATLAPPDRLVDRPAEQPLDQAGEV
jgi:hypothetical protein